MSSLSNAPKRTGYPFGFPRDDYVAEQRFRDNVDLEREIVAGIHTVELYQRLAVEAAADGDDGTRDYIEHQLPTMVDELERRRRILDARANDPLRPRWPKSDDRFRARVDAVKAAWPIERFCRELLRLDMHPAGRGRFKARCPLPGHDDKTPSFSIDTVKGLAYCHGCHRGGDVLKLTQYVLNAERFTDALAALEREGGVR